MLIRQMVAPIVLFFLMMSLPESPRWHILKARRLERQERPDYRLRIERHYEAAFLALCQLRNSKVQAGRDMFLIDAWIAMEQVPVESRNSGDAVVDRRLVHIPWKAWSQNTLTLFYDDRCRRAMTAGLIVMSLQQLCGVNVLAYYSSSVFKDSLHEDCRHYSTPGDCEHAVDNIALKVCLTMEIEVSLCSPQNSIPWASAPSILASQ